MPTKRKPPAKHMMARFGLRDEIIPACGARSRRAMTDRWGQVTCKHCLARRERIDAEQERRDALYHYRPVEWMQQERSA